MIVCQPTPNSPATAATDQSWLPTCSNAHRRARSVIADRGRIASPVSVHVFCSHRGCWHTKILFRHQTCTGTPEIGRSRTRTVQPSFTAATAPQWDNRRDRGRSAPAVAIHRRRAADRAARSRACTAGGWWCRRGARRCPGRPAATRAPLPDRSVMQKPTTSPAPASESSHRNPAVSSCADPSGTGPDLAPGPGGHERLTRGGCDGGREPATLSVDTCWAGVGQVRHRGSAGATQPRQRPGTDPPPEVSTRPPVTAAGGTRTPTASTLPHCRSPRPIGPTTAAPARSARCPPERCSSGEGPVRCATRPPVARSVQPGSVVGSLPIGDRTMGSSPAATRTDFHDIRGRAPTAPRQGSPNQAATRPRPTRQRSMALRRRRQVQDRHGQRTEPRPVPAARYASTTQLRANFQYCVRISGRHGIGK